MKFQRVLVVAIAGAVLTLGGCTGGGGDAAGPLPPVEIPTLTPEPQPFRTGTAFADGVFSVDVPTPNGGTRTLDTVRHLEGSWARFLPRPVQPDHSSREWLLAENHYDGEILLYGVVSWNVADPTDYLAAGWWLTYPPDVPFWEFESATRGVFLDGPELDPARPPDLPLTGTASYAGSMGGLYTYSYGRAWDELAGSTEITEFIGPVSLTADFDRNRLTGCLGCLEPIEIAPGSTPLSHRFLAGPRSRVVAGRLRSPLCRILRRHRGLRGYRRYRDAPRPHHRQQRRDVARTVLRTCRMRTAIPGAWSARPMCCLLRTTARMDALRASSMR